MIQEDPPMSTTQQHTATEAKIEQIRKLLALARDERAPRAEAESAAEKAALLLSKYQLDEAQVLADDTTGQTWTIADREFVVTAPYATGRAQLFYAVAFSLGVRPITHSNPKRPVGGDGGAVHLHLFGTQSQIDLVIMMFESLKLQAIIFEQQDARTSWEFQNHPRAWRRAYLLGYAKTIRHRLLAAQDRATREHYRDHGNGAELVLVNRKALVDRRVAEVYPRLRSGRRATTSSSGGWSAGRAAGNRADIGQGRIGGTNRQLGR
jgi:hypothetical protein